MTSARRALNSGTNGYLGHTLLLVDGGLQKHKGLIRPHKQADASAHITPGNIILSIASHMVKP